MTDQILDLAQQWIGKLLIAAKEVNNSDLVNLCLKVEGVKDIGGGCIAVPETRGALEGTAPKNHALRFNFEESYRGNAKTSWGFRPTRRSIFGGVTGSQDYEEVMEDAILRAPICDICIIHRGDPIPTGFYRIAKSPSNVKANLNNGSGGKTMYLCIKKDLSGNEPPIVNLIIVFPDKNDIIPPGYFPVRREAHSCNLNSGTNADRMFICYKKDKWGNPITDLQVFFPAYSENVPRSFSVIETTGSNFDADLNAGTGGIRTLLAYKHALPRLECLSLPQADATTTTSSHKKSKSGLEGPKIICDSLGDGSPIVSVDSPNISEGGGSADSNRARTETQDSVHSHPNNYGPEKSEFVAETSKDDDNESVDSNEDRNFYDIRSIMYDGGIAPEEYRKLLHPLLVALYVRQGHIAEFSLECLLNLLNQTSFFEPDFRSLPPSGFTSMLDLTIEAICDRIDIFLMNEEKSLLIFIESLVKISGGYLTTNAMQRIIRMLFFLCSCHSSSSDWVERGLLIPSTDEIVDLFAFKVLKDLIWAVVYRSETSGPAQFLPDTLVQWSSKGHETGNKDSRTLEINNNIRDLVYDFIDDIIDTVEISRISEFVLMLVSRVNTQPTSNKFWFKVISFSKRLFQKIEYRNVFIILCAFCKMARMEIREGSHFNRDLGTKLLAFQAIIELCGNACTVLSSSKVMGYQIRRLVVPCILNNMDCAFQESRVFTKMLKLISELWKHWRNHLKIEFAILCEHLIIRVLRASPTKVNQDYKLIALDEVANWIDMPHVLLEMFLNFDMDRKFVSHWNVYSHLTQAICTLAEKACIPLSKIGCDVTINKSLVVSQAKKIKEVNLKALSVVAQIAKSLMDASGHAHLILQDPIFRSRTLVDGSGWEEDEDYDNIEVVDGSTPEKSSSVMIKQRDKHNLGIRFRKAVNQEASDLLDEAIALYKKKNSLKKAVDFLVMKNFMSDTPQEVASFLHVYKNSFDPSAIGDFLGEGGITEREVEYWSQIRFRYTRAISFVEMAIENALRLFLTGCGFRLPGEAQKIDRFIEAFVKVYWQDNSGSEFCPFQHSDTIHLLSYSLIMLNTDLHRASDGGKKKRKKMTKDEFTKNLRGVDQGQDVNYDYLCAMYDSILANPIELEVHSSEIQESEESSLSNVSHLLKLEHLDSQIGTNGVADEAIFAGSISKGLRESEDVLRSLAPFTHRFQLTGVDVNISMDLIRFMFISNWLSIQEVVEVVLNSADNDEEILYLALDILSASLTSSIFLKIDNARQAFASLLIDYRKTCERLSPVHVKNRDGGLKDISKWYEFIQSAGSENAMDAISQMHGFIMVLKEDIREKFKRDILKTVVLRLEKPSSLLESNIYFVREGELNKRTRSGRLDLYRFFLFSDTLIYTHTTMSGTYRVHEELPLKCMAVADFPEDGSGCSLFVSHPVKSFMVQASNPTEKHEWLKDLMWTIQDCTRRLHERSVVEEKVRSFYVQYNPEKINDIDFIMNKYKGREFALLEQLEMQYKKPGACSPSTTSVLSPVPILHCTPDLSIDAASVLTKSVMMARINDQQDKIVENSKIVKAVTATPSPWESASRLHREQPFVESKGERSDMIEQPDDNEISEFLSKLPGEKVSKLFASGLKVWRSFLDDPEKASMSDTIFKLYGLYKQSKFGPAPAVEPENESMTPAQRFPIDCKICDAHGYTGTVRYVGTVISSSDPEAIYIGVEWDLMGRGKHDGSVKDVNGVAVSYFVCPDGMGSFSKPSKLSHLKNMTKSEKVSEAQMKAWRALGTMDSTVAKKMFIQNLVYLAPSWDYKSVCSGSSSVLADVGSSPG